MKTSYLTTPCLDCGQPMHWQVDHDCPPQPTSRKDAEACYEKAREALHDTFVAILAALPEQPSEE